MGQELLATAAIAARVCVGLVFLVAAIQKASHWSLLRGVIANYRLLPRGLTTPAALLLPPAEIVIAVLLLSGLLPLAVPLAMALLLVFATAMAINLGRGRSNIDCGCGQAFLKHPLRWSLVARNAVLALILIPALVASRPVSPAAALTGAGAGLGFLLLYLLLNTLAAIPLPPRMAAARG